MVWESPEDMPYDVIVEPSGSLLVATGGKGKIYRLSGDPTLIDARHARRTRSKSPASPRTERVVSCSRRRILVAFFASPRAPRPGHLSLRREGHGDGGDVGRHPLARGDAGGDERSSCSTRSGNTRTPDKTWSDWSKPYTIAAGRAIESPKARYLQWRAVLTGQGQVDARADVGDCRLPAAQHAPVRRDHHRAPAGRRVSAALPDRRSGARRLRREHLGRPGRAGSRRPATRRRQPLGRADVQKSLQTFVWQARDADGDGCSSTCSIGSRARRDLEGTPKRGAVRRDLHVGHDVGARRRPTP